MRSPVNAPAQSSTGITPPQGSDAHVDAVLLLLHRRSCTLTHMKKEGWHAMISSYC
jgi:hypothetical protein